MQTRSRVAALLVATLAAALLSAHPSLAVPTDPETPDIPPGDKENAPTEGTLGVGNVAHRGNSITAPENTMSAVRQAVADSGDFQGIDVYRTRDSRLVVLHDRSLARTTNVEKVFPDRDPWRVSDFSLEEVRRLDAGSWFAASYTGERIPTLTGLLRRLNQSPSGVFLELKNPSDQPGIGEQVVDAITNNTDWLKADGTDHRLVLQSFDGAYLERFNTAHPNIPVGELGGYDPSDFDWLDQINVNHSTLTPEELDRAHSAGVQVSVFVVDTRDRMEAMSDMGVDAISTNRPRLLNDVLTERGRTMLHPQYDAERATRVGSAWSASAPSDSLLATRVPVRTTFRDSQGAPVRWTWVTLQTYHSGSWHNIQRRATDLNGKVSTSLWLRRDIKVRWVPRRGSPPNAEASLARKIDGRRADTVVRLGGPDTARRGDRVRLAVRWRSENHRRVSGPATLWSRPRGAEQWSRIRTGQVTNGDSTFRVRARRTTRYQVRAAGGWWWRGD
ncbi:MAG: glycerophosphodiester phosphodiesterase, partial [Nocardioidaceae bacterium]